MQFKFDLAEFVICNKQQIIDSLRKELTLEAMTEPWYVDHNVLNYFTDAFADFVAYKIKWYLVDNSSFSYEELNEFLDKNFIADVLGQEVLTVNYWKGNS